MSKERELLRKLFESGIQPEQTETEFNQESVSEPFAGFELRVDSCPPEQIEESPPYDMRIHSNPSALAWTTFFREHNPDCNVDDDVIMLAWFANAMMAMHDHIYQSTQPEQTEQDTLTRQQGIEKYKRTQAKE